MGLIRRAHQRWRIDSVLLSGQMSRAQRRMNRQMAAGWLVWRGCAGLWRRPRGHQGRVKGGWDKGELVPYKQDEKLGNEMQIGRKLEQTDWEKDGATWHHQGMSQGKEGVNVGMETGAHGGLFINPLFCLHMMLFTRFTWGVFWVQRPLTSFHVACWYGVITMNHWRITLL